MDVGGSARNLPENAYRQLKPGETYVPVVPADKIVPEVTGYSLGMGLLFAVIFSAAAAYLGLKIGQVFEAAIPITILAIGVSAMLRQEERPAAARDDPVHRFRLGRGRGRRDLHPAGHLHPGPGRAHQLPADVPGLAAGRFPGHPAADPLPALLRQGHARRVPVPRGHGLDRGADGGRGRRRPGGRAGQERRHRHALPAAEPPDHRPLAGDLLAPRPSGSASACRSRCAWSSTC